MLASTTVVSARTPVGAQHLLLVGFGQEFLVELGDRLWAAAVGSFIRVVGWGTSGAQWDAV